MGGLFQQIVDFQNLYQAYLGARKRKRYRSSILKFGYRLEENLLALSRFSIKDLFTIPMPAERIKELIGQ
ncbi:MAG: hypothetical protein NTW60_01210 [Candidatus Wolfebacteria bacterium]|nr:hypothetical protein [Candidatus Wolfebacteria bacterium]